MINWDHITVAGAVLGLVLSAGFVTRYLQVAGRDALRNTVGRFFITRKLLLAALFTVIILNRQDPLGWESIKEPITALMVLTFAVQTVWPYRLLMEAQKEARMKEDQRS